MLNYSISLGKRQLADSIWKSAGIEGLGTTFPNTEAILENISAFVLQLSTNDAKADIPLGKISENDKYDITTSIGAIEFILEYVKKTWNCPVLIYSNPSFDSEKYGKLVEATKELQKKWKFKFLNMWDDKRFDYNEKDRQLYMVDDIHPTRAGYKMSWLPEFEKALNDIYEN